MSDNKETKFSTEEMKLVKEIQQQYVDTQHKLGQISVAEIRLSQQMDALNETRQELNTSFIKTQDDEKEFISKITKKYGDGVLNPETGIYNPKLEK
tara:strand:+ start:445 stop:732 length:288 start_codon:yes stop_codon:yes gene_type:complete